jgi:hypothetical protein
VAATADKSKQRKKGKEYPKQSAELDTHREVLVEMDVRRTKKDKTADRKEKKRKICRLLCQQAIPLQPLLQLQLALMQTRVSHWTIYWV